MPKKAVQNVQNVLFKNAVIRLAFLIILVNYGIG